MADDVKWLRWLIADLGEKAKVGTKLHTAAAPRLAWDIVPRLVPPGGCGGRAGGSGGQAAHPPGR